MKKHGREELEIEEARKRQKMESRRAKAEAAIAKLTAPPALKPDIFPLSPQAARAPRPKDPMTEEARKKWPGPGDYEFNWKDNPHKDHSMAIRDSIPDDMYEPPIVRAMPNRKPLNNLSMKLPFVEDATVFYPSRIPASGDCFFGSGKVMIHYCYRVLVGCLANNLSFHGFVWNNHVLALYEVLSLVVFSLRAHTSCASAT